MPLIHLIAFELVWFSSVIGAAHGHSWMGPTATLLLVAWHLAGVRQPAREMGVLLAAMLLGSLLDELITASGLVRYISAPGSGIFAAAQLIPFWIVTLWLAFATTLNTSLRWLQKRLPLAAVLGGLGAAIAYSSAARLGAVQLPHLWPALATVAVAWAMLLPLLCLLAERFASLPRKVSHG